MSTAGIFPRSVASCAGSTVEDREKVDRRTGEKSSESRNRPWLPAGGGATVEAREEIDGSDGEECARSENQNWLPAGELAAVDEWEELDRGTGELRQA
jgi:hypothetical protein